MLCKLLLLADPAEDDQAGHHRRYVATTVETKSVIDKIVHSVYINVVNTGQDTDRLPDELRAVCQKGHRLTMDRLSSIIHTLTVPRDKIIVELTYLVEDLALWLLLHFSGTLLVTVCGKVIYQQPLGDSAGVVELKVQNFCSGVDDCSKKPNSCRVLNDVKDHLEDFLDKEDFENPPSSSVSRKQLYDVETTYDNVAISTLPSAVGSAVHATARVLIQWLLCLPLGASSQSEFAFAVQKLPGFADAKVESFSVGDVLYRSPAFLNTSTNDKAVARMVYHRDDVPQMFSGDMLLGICSDLPAEPRAKIGPDAWTAGDLLHEFPILRELVMEAKTQCRCHSCSKGPVDRQLMGAWNLPSGCYAESAVKLVSLLIAHAVADGFGAPDVSGSRNPDYVLKALYKIFGDLIEEKRVRWDSWFGLASCVYLGCPLDPITIKNGDGGSAYAAMQYGNLALIAPWVDFFTKHALRHSFRMKYVVGRIVVRRGPASRPYYRGVFETFAVVKAAHTEDVSGYGRKFEKWPEPPGKLNLTDDHSDCESETMLLSVHAGIYQLMLRMCSHTTLRVIDPVDSMICLARDLPAVECEHELDYKTATVVRENIKLYTFDDLLSYWPTSRGVDASKQPGSSNNHQASQTSTYHVTHVLRNPAEVNVALALLAKDVYVLNSGRCCLACALAKADRLAPSADGASKSNPDRYIINTAHAQKDSLILARSNRQCRKT
jgi:hypothetical protein